MSILDFFRRKKPVIMIVDDDPGIVTVLATHLEMVGFKTIKIFDGPSVLQEAAEKLPQLILLDIRMGHANGLDILRRLKQGRKARDIPVLMATAEQKGADVDTAFRNGADGYVIKPFDLERLEAKVRKALADAEARAGSW
jgi:DNA-binding response OmpR family regulator